MSINPNSNLPINSVWNKKNKSSIVDNLKNENYKNSEKYYEYDHPVFGHVVTKLGLFTSNSKNKLYDGVMVTPKVNSSIRNRMFLENKLDTFDTQSVDKYYDVNFITTESVPNYISSELYDYEMENDSINIDYESDESSESDYDYSSNYYVSSDEETEYLDMSYDY
jgi:hypothetical protein